MLLFLSRLVDPDAPSRSQPSNKEWIHWLVVNIPNGGLNYGGDTAIEYFRPTPPAGSGLHRYAFIIWDQGTRTIPKTEFPHIKAHDAHGRSHWKVLQKHPVIHRLKDDVRSFPC
jgi:phosphatidylethanolamine-binding protein (PEBP) family uncharacterized protein